MPPKWTFAPWCSHRCFGVVVTFRPQLTTRRCNLPGILATTPWACGRLKQQQTSAVTPLHRLRMCVPLCPASMYLPLTGCSLLVTGGERSTRCDARNLPVTNDG